MLQTADPQNVPGPRPRFPGQLIWELTRDPLAFFTRVARQYPGVAYWPMRRFDFYLLSDPQLIRDVLVTKSASFIKTPALRRAKVTLGEGLLTSEGDFHKRQRRLSQPAFHPQRVATYAQVFAGYAKNTAAEWRDGQTLDMHEQMMRLTLRIVAKTLFDAEVEQEIEEIGRAMDISVGMFSRAMTPWGPLLNMLPLPSNFRYYRAHNRLSGIIDRFIAQRRQSGVDQGDLLSMLLRARDAEGDGGQMDDRQLRDECYTLFTAGHETTANALTFTWYLLAKYPDVAAKLHAEVDAAAGEDLLGVADLERLPYTRAVIAESMRLYPPAWTIGRQAKEDVALSGLSLKKDDVVLFSQWVMHRHPDFWPEPEKFLPDRWLDETASRERPRYAYFPFGGGPRQCIGESFAWMEAILALATIARDWTMTYTGREPLELQPTITLRPKHGLAMQLKRRIQNAE